MGDRMHLPYMHLPGNLAVFSMSEAGLRHLVEYTVL
jgi:hypothetical protein